MNKNYKFCEGPLLTDSYKFSHYRQYPICYFDTFKLESPNNMNFILDDSIHSKFKEYVTKFLPTTLKGANFRKGGYNISYFEPRSFKLKFPYRDKQYQMLA